MNSSTKEKICAFYASDYHFEMISLPYINKRMENNDEIIILTENNLEETIQTLLSKMNFKEEKKKNILKINWKNNDLEKIEKIKTKINEEKDMVVFIKGKKKYINNINKNIEKSITNYNNIKIIDCYDIEEIGEDMNKVMGKYMKVLRTTGEKNINSN